MSVNAHLSAVAIECYVRDDERAALNTSIGHIQSALRSHFNASIAGTLVFGSFRRGTILPRRADPLSDVDLMVVFRDTSGTPQTYLNRLRRFVEARYQRSEIRQSNPTIQLGMGHIQVELVPAVEAIWAPYNIPAKARDYQDWIGTDPNGFDREVTSANQNNRNLVKPLCRVLKRWNVTANRPFDSYELERQIVENSPGAFFPYQNHADAFYRVVPHLDLGWNAARWKRDALARLKQTAAQAQQSERSFYAETARQQIARLIPLINAGVR